MKRKIVWCVLALALVPASVFAQPNMLDVVERISREDPARFACAHTGRSCSADWINAVASALHAIDPKFGLVGQRGNPNDIGEDVVSYREGPTDYHVAVFDICGSCGDGSFPKWDNITVRDRTYGSPTSAIWVKPAAVGGVSSGGGGTPSPAPPSTVPAVDYTAILNALAAKLDLLTVKVDAVAGVAVEARDAAKSAEFDARDLAGRPQAPVPVLSVPCLRGRVPKPFGGSSDVTFCPVPE